MTDYEVLSLVLMILGIITSLLISFINQSKSNRQPEKLRLLS